MAKIDRVQEVSTELLVPYANNAKKHSQEQVDKIAESIQEFGFLSPCLIDQDYNIIAGHGRVMASLQLGLPTVPCVFIEGLTDAQRRAYILADNRLTELGDWDFRIVQDELEILQDEDFNIDLTGFEVKGSWFDTRERYDNDNDNETDEYREFVEKFKQKRTTDDCYTPDGIYDVVADWVATEYDLDRKNFVRPFYPGGDYQNEKYPADCVVVDNPPFSLMSEIVNFYTSNDIRFFLFSPGLVGLSDTQVRSACKIVADADITYENGAQVRTAFTTNLEGETVLKTAPRLHNLIEEKDDEIRAERRVELPKYEYPTNVVTLAMAGQWAKLGIEFEVDRSNCVRISGLDSQEEAGKEIYGGVYC